MDHPIQRVLIVENDRLFQAFLQEALSAAGYTTLTCATLAAASHLACSAPPNLVMLDLYVDGPGSSLEFLAWLRQEWAIATTPVIICAADKRLLRAQAPIFHAHHCFAVIEKPFQLEDLLTTVDAAIGPGEVRCTVSAA